jgi:hypothetical protein
MPKNSTAAAVTAALQPQTPAVKQSPAEKALRADPRFQKLTAGQKAAAIKRIRGTASDIAKRAAATRASKGSKGKGKGSKPASKPAASKRASKPASK